MLCLLHDTGINRGAELTCKLRLQPVAHKPIFYLVESVEYVGWHDGLLVRGLRELI